MEHVPLPAHLSSEPILQYPTCAKNDSWKEWTETDSALVRPSSFLKPNAKAEHQLVPRLLLFVWVSEQWCEPCVLPLALVHLNDLANSSVFHQFLSCVSCCGQIWLWYVGMVRHFCLFGALLVFRGKKLIRSELITWSLRKRCGFLETYILCVDSCLFCQH